MNTWAAAILTLTLAAGSAAQDDGRQVSLHGRAAVIGDVLPGQDAIELRPRLSISLEAAPNRWSRVRFDARAEALAANRDGGTTDAAARVMEAWFEVHGRRADLRAGRGRLAWGRLDEVSPGDVVNPIDAARYLFEGRSEARLPVNLVRGRIFPSDQLTVEAVLVPVFERSRFDELDEPTSPFNLSRDLVLPAGVQPTSSVPVQVEPARAWRNVAGGARVLATIGRVDVAGVVYRGFEAFGPVTFEPEVSIGPSPSIIGRLVERHPRFTIVGADLETVSGAWAWRAEVVATVEKSFAASGLPGLVSGRAIDAGAGFDRRAGDYRMYLSLLAHHEWAPAEPGIERTDVTVVGSLERPFGRDRYLVRGFVVVSPDEGAGFLRGVLRWRMSDPAAFEFSAGAFLGAGENLLGRFRDRDFAFMQFSYDF